MPEFTFMREIQIPQDIFPLLIQGEQPVCAFATFRDGSVFTNKRVILRDVQGMTGNKVQVMSLPYSQIVSWASENAGTFDADSELTLNTRAGIFKLNLRGGIDVRALDNLIAQVVLV